MRFTKHFLLAAAAGAAFLLTPQSKAQIAVGVQLGAAPVCPYGYYGYAPYHCAPYGYYGPEWFSNGIFVGAGPWYHGDAHFHGYVDEHFDERHGYHGPYPGRDEHYRAYNAGEFHGHTYYNAHGETWHEGHR